LRAVGTLYNKRSAYKTTNPLSCGLSRLFGLPQNYWHGLSLYHYMAQQNTKKIGPRPVKTEVTRMDTLHDTWKVMKPFVHFSVKAMQVIAHGLIFIVKNIPKPDDHKPNAKNDKVIKI
jgi:hypothetical protein